MSNNIISFNPVSTSKAVSVNTASASKNIINSILTDTYLNYQSNNKGAYENNANFSLIENPLSEYTLEELLAEGTKTQVELEKQRKIEEEKKAELEKQRKIEEEKKAAELKTKKQKELEKLYEARDENNGFFHPIKESEIEEQILELEQELDVPHKPDGWEEFCDVAEDAGATVVTFSASAIEGVVDVGEAIVDGTVQVGGGLISYGVGLVDEEAGATMKQGIQDFVSYDASGVMYDTFVDAAGIDEDIAYGWAHTAGTFAGQVVGYGAITIATGGAATVALSGLASAGSAAETAYANGASFDESMVTSTASGFIGAVAGGGMDKLGTLAKGATTLKGVAGYTAAGMAVGGLEPVVNSVVEYATYGNDNYNSFGEYYTASGGLLNTAIGMGAGGLSTGVQSFMGYKTNTSTKVDTTKVNNKLEASTMDRIKNKLYLNDQGKISDEYAFEVYKKSIDDAIETARKLGNKDVENMLEKLYLLKDKRPNFAINFDPNNGAFSRSRSSGSISLGEDVLIGNQKGVVYHELGHTLHGAINNSQVPTNYMNVKNSVYDHMSNNIDYVISVMDYLQNSQNLAYTDATKYFDDNLSNLVIDKLNQTNWDDVANNFRKVGFSEDEIQKYIMTKFEKQYNNIRNSEISRLANNYLREWGLDAVSDITCSVFNGNARFPVIDSNGNMRNLNDSLIFGHSETYFTKYTDANGNIVADKPLEAINECSFHEQMANFVQLKLSGNTSTLDMLHGLLGDDWYQMMETEFNSITNYFK